MTGSRHEYMLHESFHSKKDNDKDVDLQPCARSYHTYTRTQSKRKRGGGIFCCIQD